MAGISNPPAIEAFPDRVGRCVKLADGVSAEEFLALPEGERRLELYDGEVWMAPSPRGRHQRMAYLIGRAIGPFIEEHRLGLLYTSPVDIRIGPNRVVAPDMCLLAPDHPQAGEDWTHLTHPPLLVVEIASPSTRRRDWGTKFSYYEEFGVPNYWTVEVDERQIHAHVLTLGHYREVPQPNPRMLAAPPLAGLVLDLDALFGEP